MEAALMRWVAVLMAVMIGNVVFAAVLPADNLTPYQVEKRLKEYFYQDNKLFYSGKFPFSDCFQQAARKSQLPQSLLLAVARGESAFDPQARSSADAYGLMQIRWPQTARHLGIDRRSALLDPCTNVDAGARYLQEMLKRYNGNLYRALAAYNYGPGRIPIDGGQIPKGASWYSGYILGHLQYVLQGDGAVQGRLLLIRFQRPYRAAAFVQGLQKQLDGARLEWFREPKGGFQVVLSYQDQQQLNSGRRALKRAGFQINQ